ncbi:MAG: hypothetical protein ACP5D2_03940 [Candidatus Nanoarchaeia archaeon]
MEERIYHGTCMAFVQLANEREGLFGPDYDSVSFTPDINHARMFANSWQTSAGRARLAEMFGNIPEQLVQPVILTFNPSELGQLNQTLDGNAIEYYVERGPVQINV